MNVGKSAFEIYDFRYRTKPESGMVSHGGQKILVLQDGKYIGQYALSTPPLQTISVQGATVRIDVPANVGNAVTFNEGGPPTRAWLNGESLSLDK